jgi:hypothetical protein
MQFQRHFYSIIGLFLTLSLAAQSRFGGGVVVGLNAAQILGDKSAGYNKWGLNAGLRGTVQLNTSGNFLLSTELLFSQRGARSTISDAGPFNRDADLDYLEIPIMVSFLDWAKIDKNDRLYHKIHFTGGFSFSNLFRAQLSDPFNANHPRLTTNQLAQRDYSFLLGVSFYATRHWFFQARYTRSMNWLFHPDRFADDPNFNRLDPLRGYFLTFQTGWMF